MGPIRSALQKLSTLSRRLRRALSKLAPRLSRPALKPVPIPVPVRTGRGEIGIAGRRNRRLGRRGTRIIALALAAGVLPTALGPLQQASPAAAADETAYKLVDTWQGRPWTLTAGRYGRVLDISSAPDGRVYVLDGRTDAGRLTAIHVLNPDGTPRRVFEIPGQVTPGNRWLANRIDVGFDGRIHVLSHANFRSGSGTGMLVQHLDTNGIELGRFETELPFPQSYTDIAARFDKRLYLVRTGWNPWCIPPGTAFTGPVAENTIDVYSAEGVLVEQLNPEEMMIGLGIDIGRDDLIHIINRVPSTCDGEGGPEDPTPTPRPSFGGESGSAVDSAERDGMLLGPDGDQAAAAAAPLADPIDGILIMDGDHVVQETVPFISAEDIAVGPAGVFVSRQVEIFQMVDGGPGARRFDDRAVHSGPAGRTYGALLGRLVFHLDVPARGQVLASMDHCYFQGVVRFDDVAGRPAPFERVGMLDSPELEGPAFPIRVAADDEVGVLLGRFDIRGSRPAQSYESTSIAWQAQTVQRWGTHGDGGELGAQLGLCAGSDSWWTRDVAMDGEAVYTIDNEFIQRRPDEDIPEWSAWPGLLLDDPDVNSYLNAVSADAGRVAALDLGARSVVIFTEDGDFDRTWPLGSGVTVDLALSEDRVYLADQARSRVEVKDLDGADIGGFQTHDGPRAIAAGPTGDVFVLGRGNWGFHYSADGTLRAAWPMPDRTVEARDIAVDADGRVYVNFVKLGEPEILTWDQRLPIEQAGVWVFEATEIPDVALPPPTEGCTAAPDKFAAPYRIPLGDTVEVTLEVEGRCPARVEPAQVMFMFDTSRSMNFEDALGVGKEVVIEMLGELSPDLSTAGLVTFDDGPTLREPLTNDIGAVRATVAALSADGDTRLGGALNTAYLEMTGPRADPDARRVLVIVTDGVTFDESFPLDVGDDLRAAGIEIFVLLFPARDLEEDDLLALEALAGGSDHVIMTPDRSRGRALMADLTGYTPEDGLFDTITIVDEVPGNMRYIVGSAVPPAAWDPGARTLTWTFGPTLAIDLLEMTYTLEPLEVGTWPTNVEARGPYTDALGFTGELVFPIPIVEVYALDHVVYLPFGVSNACLRKARPLDVVLVIDSSSSMNFPSVGGDRTKIQAALDAAGSFLDLIDLSAGAKSGTDRASIVAFNVESRIVAPFTDDDARLRLGLASIETQVGTRIDRGLESAAEALESRRGSALPVVVLMTDGIQPETDDVLAAADTVKATGALIYTIGLGADVEPDLLRRVATDPDRFYSSPSAEDLARIYSEIFERIACDSALAP